MSDSGTIHGGHCLCRAVKFEAAGASEWVGNCHCESCRRATGAPMATFAGYRESTFTYSAGTPRAQHSAPGVTREFCGDCGTALTYRNEVLGDAVHVLVAAFDNPADFEPMTHVFYGERLPWLIIGDNLPKYETLAGHRVDFSSDRDKS